MSLSEVNMCIESYQDKSLDLNGMMAELLNSDGIVVKTKGEGFAIWLLKLYIMSSRSAHLDLTDDY